jgi:hypothetical protein
LEGPIQSSWQNAPHFLHITIAFRLQEQSFVGCDCANVDTCIPTLAGRPPFMIDGILLFVGGALDDRRIPVIPPDLWTNKYCPICFSVSGCCYKKI